MLATVVKRKGKVGYVTLKYEAPVTYPNGSLVRHPNGVPVTTLKWLDIKFNASLSLSTKREDADRLESLRHKANEALAEWVKNGKQEWFQITLED